MAAPLSPRAFRGLRRIKRRLNGWAVVFTAERINKPLLGGEALQSPFDHSPKRSETHLKNVTYLTLTGSELPAFEGSESTFQVFVCNALYVGGHSTKCL